MRNILFVLFLFITPVVIGQLNFSGLVLNEENQPIQFAQVFLMEFHQGTKSAEDGTFSFENLSPETFNVRIRAFGYDEKIISFELTESNTYLSARLTKDKSIQELEETTVTGTMKEISKSESPVPVEIYSAEFFKANPTPSLFESMQNVNGVKPQLNCNVCNTGDIHVNGLEGPYTMILIDGMPIVSGLSTVYGLTGIPQDLIERIEIVKGPASTLYGSEAVGGLINVITKNPENAPLLSGNVMTTSWLENTVDLATKIKLGKKADALLGVNYFNYNNPIDNNNDNFTDVTLQDRISIFNKINIKRKNNKVFSLAGRYNYEDRWGGEMNWSPKFRGGDSIYGESIYTSRWEFFSKYELPTTEKISLQISANGHNHNSAYGTTLYKADQYVLFGQLVYNKTIFNKNDLLIGTALRYTFYDDNTFATNNATYNPHTYLPGLFIQDDVKLNEQNRLLLGLRYDYNSNHGNIFTPRINYKWNSENKLNIIRLSAGNGYRVANVFTEDHAALTGSRTVEFQEKLNPETSYNANINIEKKILSVGRSIINIDATAFYTYFTNRILADYDTDPNKIIYSNIDGISVSRGASLSASVLFYNSLKVKTAITLLDVFYEENEQRFSQILTEKYSGNWSVSYTIPKLKIKLDYTGNIYGPMRLPLISELDNRDEFSPVFSLQNIQLTKELKRISFYGGIKNFLNYTPPANSIARSFDPFDKEVQFNANGEAIATPNNPNALTFDPSYVFAPNQGARFFIGLRVKL